MKARNSGRGPGMSEEGEPGMVAPHTAVTCRSGRCSGDGIAAKD